MSSTRSGNPNTCAGCASILDTPGVSGMGTADPVPNESRKPDVEAPVSVEQPAAATPQVAGPS